MLGVIADAPVELLLAGIDAREHGGARERLEGRAHREALVRAIAGRAAVARIERRDAETPADLFLDAGELGLKRRRGQPRGPRRHMRPSLPHPRQIRAC